MIGFFLILFWTISYAQPMEKMENGKPERLEIGYSVPVSRIQAEKMKKAYQAGIRHVEASGMNIFFDKNGEFTKDDREVETIMKSAKEAADQAGINIWSVHMPFSEAMDLSKANENERNRVVEGHLKLLKFLEILEPEIILFHPSYYLDPPGEREVRKNQLIHSVNELNEKVMAMGAKMVVENMLGPKLMKGKIERPLLRTVEETREIFERFPESVGLAIDMNHIKNPEVLIRQMGHRLMTIHVADGTGEAEDHFFPCSGEGKNDWNEILTALEEVNYRGPFVFESAYDSEKHLAHCYQEVLFQNFLNSLD